VACAKEDDLVAPDADDDDEDDDGNEEEVLSTAFFFPRLARIASISSSVYSRETASVSLSKNCE